MESKGSVKWKDRLKCDGCGFITYDREEFSDHWLGKWKYAEYYTDYSYYADEELAEEKPEVHGGETHPNMPNTITGAFHYDNEPYSYHPTH